MTATDVENTLKVVDMRIFSLLVEPAEYTLSLIRQVYERREIEYAFIKTCSCASSERVDALESKSTLGRFCFFWARLRGHDAFIVNGYTGRIVFEFILLNLIFFRKPFVLESDTEFRIPLNYVKRACKWLWLHFLFTRRCCYGGAGGFFEHRRLFSHYGMPDDHIFTLPMMVDNAIYSHGVNTCKSRDIFRFGYVGRLTSLKRVDMIIQAFKRLVSSSDVMTHYKNVELVIVGAGEERSNLVRLAEGIPVRFVGALFGMDKVRTLQGMDCLVLASCYEPWGLVVNEALACGIPVIVSDSVGCRHDLVEGINDLPRTGLVFRTGDIEGLAHAMLDMTNDLGLNQSLGRNALKRMSYWNFDLYQQQLSKWVCSLNNGAG